MLILSNYWIYHWRRILNMTERKVKIIAILFLVVAFLGFVDATFLTVKHYLQSPINCSFIVGCDKVTKSEFSVMAGVPVALLGSLYYLAMFLGAVLYFDRRNPVILRWISWGSFAGFAASIYFVALQAFVIQAFCEYCLLSALTSTTLFVTGLVYLKGATVKPINTDPHVTN